MNILKFQEFLFESVWKRHFGFAEVLEEILVEARNTGSLDNVDHLAKAFQESGSQRDYEALYNNSWKKIRNLLIQKFGVIDQDLLNDIVADTFVQIHDKIHQYDTKYNFYTWAFTIAKNIYLKILARNQRHMSLDDDDTYLQIASDEKGYKQEYDIIHDYIDSLNAKKAAVMRGLMDDKSYQQISDETGLSVSNIKVIVMRAKEELRKIFANYDF